MQVSITDRFMQVSIAGHRFRRTATCDCGWHGKSHWLRGSAVVEAGTHAAQSGHMPMPAYVVRCRPSNVEDPEGS